MEATSLGTGSASLPVQLFNVAVTGYKLIESFRSTGKESRIVFTKFELENQRFRVLGAAMRLNQNPWPGLGDEQLNRVVTNTLCSIALFLTDADKLVGRYGLKKDNLSVQPSEIKSHTDAIATLQEVNYSTLGDVEHIAHSLEQYRAVINHTQSSVSTWRKCRWVLIDREKFNNLAKELRYKNDALHCLLSREKRSVVAELLNYELLSTNDATKLGDISVAGLEGYSQISQKAAIKKDILLLHESPAGDSNLIIRSRDITNEFTSGPGRSLAQLSMRAGDTKPVLIEWKRKGFLPHQELDKQNAELIRARIQRLVVLLKSKAPEEFRTLPCLGYCEDHDFGLAYELPSGAHPKGAWSLDQLLSDKEINKKIHRGKPPLEARFRLAHALAQALSAFHSVNWLHKGISATNILFFPIGSAIGIDVTNPYVTGFDFSRDLGDIGLSENTDAASDSYRHPNYSSDKPFQKSFDVYALGLILLQIAYWEPLARLTSLVGPNGLHSGVTHHDIRDYMLRRYIDNGSLQYQQGTEYAAAVNYCLNLGFSREFDDSKSPMEPDSYFSIVTTGLAAFSRSN